MSERRRPYVTQEVVRGLHELYNIVREDPKMVEKITAEAYEDVVQAADWLARIDKYMKRQRRLAKTENRRRVRGEKAKPQTNHD